jgi:predicted adenine nucleotide alpha hydrolase (AANH) superfamily ATPase
MKILMHICCAPCTIYPLRVLRESGSEVTGLFFNPNIHPYLEYRKRAETLRDYASGVGLKVVEGGYPLEEFLRNVVFRESDRCRCCYYMRLAMTAEKARSERFDGFTTTLLYSKFQRHELVKEICESLAKSCGIAFIYRDFREGWNEGVDKSKELGLYRQPYCGCIYSEKERYWKGTRPRTEPSG